MKIEKLSNVYPTHEDYQNAERFGSGVYPETLHAFIEFFSDEDEPGQTASDILSALKYMFDKGQPIPVHSKKVLISAGMIEK